MQNLYESTKCKIWYSICYFELEHMHFYIFLLDMQKF